MTGELLRSVMRFQHGQSKSLVATELRSLDSLVLKSGMVQGTEETLAVAIDIGFFTADTSVKNVFLRVMEVTNSNDTINNSVEHKPYEDSSPAASNTYAALRHKQVRR